MSRYSWVSNVGEDDHSSLAMSTPSTPSGVTWITAGVSTAESYTKSQPIRTCRTLISNLLRPLPYGRSIRPGQPNQATFRSDFLGRLPAELENRPAARASAGRLGAAEVTGQ